eukprot:TRINITY_DN8676_c0_g1_i4.p2 TRINITY_DN8676_c0_g1~~TRINITY_DN8676_c0_g1_i4.p2  ORF type:complete len:363 (+),score=77.76 TRINITY_DN8676_c0_g1_i4:248-1336(+)
MRARPRSQILLAIIYISAVLANSNGTCAQDSCDVAQAEPDVHAILRENLFLKEMLRKAQAQQQAAQATPWWQRRREHAPDTKGVLGIYFATPIFRTNINLIHDNATVARINSKLEAAIMRTYLETVDSGIKYSNVLHQTPQDSLGENQINNIFFSNQNTNNMADRASDDEAIRKLQDMDFSDFEPYSEQANRPEPSPSGRREGFLDHMKEMSMVKRFWRDSIGRFWNNVPGNVMSLERLMKEESADFFYWAAVNHHGIEHKTHVHFRSYISGVYYIKTPPLSGLFHFYDARGYSMYPFNDARESFRPSAGDLVLFPGYVPHSVDATPGADPRIAIAFNLDVSSSLRCQGLEDEMKFHNLGAG